MTKMAKAATEATVIMNAVLAVDGKCVVDPASPVPSPGPGELLVKVHACGVNRLDTMQRQGKAKPPPGASLVLGMEVAGEVRSSKAAEIAWS